MRLETTNTDGGIKMKKLILAILTAAVSLGITAHASYQCVDYNNQLRMRINENHVTRIGNTSIHLVSATTNTRYYGIIHSEAGLLMSKKIMQIFPFQGNTLTIVSKPKNCGRGSCDFNASQDTIAQLKIGETQTNFQCNEANP